MNRRPRKWLSLLHTLFNLPFIPNIERFKTFKLLGVIVSNDLKWNSHIAYVCLCSPFSIT